MEIAVPLLLALLLLVPEGDRAPARCACCCPARRGLSDLSRCIASGCSRPSVAGYGWAVEDGDSASLAWGCPASWPRRWPGGRGSGGSGAARRPGRRRQRCSAGAAALRAVAALAAAVLPVLPVSTEMEPRFALAPWTCSRSTVASRLRPPGAAGRLARATGGWAGGLAAAGLAAAAVAGRRVWRERLAELERMSIENRFLARAGEGDVLSHPASPLPTLGELRRLRALAGGAGCPAAGSGTISISVSGARPAGGCGSSTPPPVACARFRPQRRAARERACGEVRWEAPLAARFTLARATGSSGSSVPTPRPAYAIVFGDGTERMPVPPRGGYRIARARGPPARALRGPGGLGHLLPGAAPGAGAAGAELAAAVSRAATAWRPRGAKSASACQAGQHPAAGAVPAPAAEPQAQAALSGGDRRAQQPLAGRRGWLPPGRSLGSPSPGRTARAPPPCQLARRDRPRSVPGCGGAVALVAAPRPKLRRRARPASARRPPAGARVTPGPWRPPITSTPHRAAILRSVWRIDKELTGRGREEDPGWPGLALATSEFQVGRRQHACPMTRRGCGGGTALPFPASPAPCAAFLQPVEVGQPLVGGKPVGSAGVGAAIGDEQRRQQARQGGRGAALPPACAQARRRQTGERRQARSWRRCRNLQGNWRSRSSGSCARSRAPGASVRARVTSASAPRPGPRRLAWCAMLLPVRRPTPAPSGSSASSTRPQ